MRWRESSSVSRRHVPSLLGSPMEDDTYSYVNNVVEVGDREVGDQQEEQEEGRDEHGARTEGEGRIGQGWWRVTGSEGWRIKDFSRCRE